MKEARKHSSRGAVGDSLRARRKRKARRALVSYAMAFCVLYAGTWHLAHHPTFEVSGVAVEGNVVTPDERVAAAARAALASPALSLLPMTNAYLARPGLVEEAVEAALPEVATATVTRDGQELVVRVEERARFGYWCRSTPSTGSGQAGSGQAAGGGEDCFALDRDGMIFAREAPPSGATRFEGLVAAANPIRERYAPDEAWENLAAAVEGVRAAGLSPARVTTADGIDFKIALAEGPYLLVDATHPGAQAIENLRVALDDDSLAALRGYEYADLRLPHKVFLRAVPSVSE